MTEALFAGLILAVGLERVVELIVSERHRRATLSAGGVERGAGHYPMMVVIHVGLLAGALGEVLALDRPFLPGLGRPMLVLVLAAQALRWWCVATLGPAWCTRVVVVPGAQLVASGPYRFLRHPNYVAVVLEGAALPLVHTAWLTAVLFTVANLAVLRVRIRVEERALAELAAPA